MISPSPFSSTLTAVVADTFLSHLDSITSISPTNVRSRPSLRNSLFAPAQELPDSERGAVSAVERGHGLFGGYLEGGGSGREGEQGTRREGYIRGRARSLSHTLGELFGVGRPVVRRVGENEEEEEEAGNGGRLERARTTAGASRSEERL